MESRVVLRRRAPRAAALPPRRPQRWWQHPLAQGAACLLAAVALDRGGVKPGTVLAATALTCAAMLSGGLTHVAEGIETVADSVEMLAESVADGVACVATSLDGVAAGITALGVRVREGVSPAALPPTA